MSVSTLEETRTFDRRLEYARQNSLPGITQNAIDAQPLISMMAGQLAAPMFGAVGQGGQGKRVLGGESIVVKVRLGKNTTPKTLTGGYDTYDTTPSDTVRHGRANWKLYGGTVNISEHEIETSSGEFAEADLVGEEMREGVESLVDELSTDIHSNAGAATSVSQLDDIISAASGTTAIYGLSNTTYGNWKSRGLSARGTAGASISYTGGSFAATGLSNWRIAWNNAWEGNERPQALVTTHDLYGFYEGSLQPQERFNSPVLADGGFQTLQYKTAPILPDPKNTSGVTWFLNFNHLFLAVLAGTDFNSGPFSEPDAQRVRISKVFVTCEMICTARKLQNKITGQTA